MPAGLRSVSGELQRPLAYAALLFNLNSEGVCLA